jgi:hypothetical protein
VIAGKIGEGVRKDMKEIRGAKWKTMKDKVAHVPEAEPWG